MRLDRILASSGYGTRSEIKDLIRRGKVTVDGQTVKDPSMHVSGQNVIEVDKTPFLIRQNLYYMLNKPDNMLTAMEDRRLDTIASLIPQFLKNRKISPVGRLDYHSTGLLLLTNDGELSHRLTSPKYLVPKVYRVAYEGPDFTAKEISEIASGLLLDDTDEGTALMPASLSLTGKGLCEITLTEGKTHEVRRIVSHFGRKVITLHRIPVGPLELPDSQAPGELRELTPDEESAIKSACGMSEL